MEGLSIIRITKENVEYFKPLFFDLSPGKENILLGTVYEGCACGVCEISVKGDLASIEHFYIAEDYRRRGIGTAFMDYIIDGLEDSVSNINTVYGTDEEYAHEFLGTIGFYRMKRAEAYSVPYSMPKLVEQAPTIEATELEKYRLNRQTRSVVTKSENLLRSLGYQTSISNKDACSKKNSFVIVDNNKVKGVMINSIHENDIYVDYITASDPKTVFKLICLLASSLTYEKISPENIVFLALSDKSLKLIEHLYPDTPINTEFSMYDAIFEY